METSGSRGNELDPIVGSIFLIKTASDLTVMSVEMGPAIFILGSLFLGNRSFNC